MKKFLLIALSVVIMASMVLFSCAEPEEPTPEPTPMPSPAPEPTPMPTPAPAKQYGGILKIITPGNVTTFGNPAVMRPDGEMYAYVCLQGITYFDLRGEFLPKLATKYEIGPDGKSVKLHLRKGVTYHDGTAFNAQSVKDELDIVRAVRGEFKDIESIDIIDEYTVQLNLLQYNNLLVTHLGSIPGKQVSPTAFKLNGEEWAKTNPVGTGPYKLKEFLRDVHLKYERFDNYWGGKPYLDGVEYYFKADQTTAKMAFLAGEGQILMGVQPKDAGDLKARGYEVVYTNSIQYFLSPSSKNADSPFADVKVRQAVEYAIDREAIAKGPGYGYWQANYHIMPPDVVGYNADLEPRMYDPAKARQLLADAGYPDGFKTTFYAMQPGNDGIVPIITYLKEVGIDAELKMETPTSIFSLSREGWEGLVFSGYGVDPNNLHRIEADLGERNLMLASILKPVAFTSKIDEAMAETTFEGRKKAMEELDKIVYDNAMVISLWRDATIAAFDETVQDCNLNKDHFVHWDPSTVWLKQ